MNKECPITSRKEDESEAAGAAHSLQSLLAGDDDGEPQHLHQFFFSKIKIKTEKKDEKEEEENLGWMDDGCDADGDGVLRGIWRVGGWVLVAHSSSILLLPLFLPPRHGRSSLLSLPYPSLSL